MKITYTLSHAETHKQIATCESARKVIAILQARRNLSPSETYVTEWADDEILSQINGEEFLREVGL